MLRQLLTGAFKRSTSPALRAAGDPVPGAEGPYLAYLLLWDAPTRLGPGGALTSPLASTRLRTLIPGRELARGLPAWILPLQEVLHGGGLPPGAPPAAVVLGKLSVTFLAQQPTNVRALISWLDAHAAGLRLFADVSDDYAATGERLLRDYQDALLRQCTLVVPCEALREALAPHARRGVHVVEDAYELGAGVPRAHRGGPLHLCWFGNFAGPTLASMQRALSAIVTHLRGQELRLEMVTGPAHQRDAAARLGAELRASHPAIDLVLTEWSPQSTERALANCHFVLLPQDVDSPSGRVKSHNRLVEAIRAGRLAIASPIPSYAELRDFAWVEADLLAGLDWAIANPAAAEARIRAGQAYVETRFAPAVVARKWAAVLGLPAPAVSSAAPPREMDAPVRLNLGCGDKILPGYVNVDIAPSRAGQRPDVLCDLHRLEPFADAAADEVMAIHVVEHFWRWEVADVLREWLRVLKPGGRMILECPNLLTACEELLKDPRRAAGPGQEGQRTMWVLYGDPHWQDPLMCHRWNYTPQSLQQLMEEAGLVNVRQEPAQFKLREPRDMRLVGEKPARR
jgi:hypothetical protein